MVRMRLHTKRIKKANQLGAGGQDKIKNAYINNAVITTATITTGTVTTLNPTTVGGDTVNVSKALSITGTLLVAGTATLNGAVNIANTLSPDTVNVSKAMSITGTLLVAGAATLNGGGTLRSTVTVVSNAALIIPTIPYTGANVTEGAAYATGGYFYIGVGGAWKSGVLA